MSDAPAHRLLLVHAHPDDESIGQGATMAKYVAQGRGVTLVTCTAGEMGEILVPELEHLAADKEDGLGEHRRGELDEAMQVLGVTDHRFLGGFGTYRDSGMKWHEDGHAIAADEVHENAFWHADLTEAANHLVAVVREVRPQVLVTYDEFGGYGHPDHIQAHRVAMYAAQLAAVPAYRKDLGEPWEIAKIYWGAMSQSRMREGLRRLRDAGDTTTFEGMDPDGTLPAFFRADEDITAEVDGSGWIDQKMAAMKAHRTQITTDGPFFALSNNDGQMVWGRELFVLAKGTPGPVGDNGWETDLFAGIPGVRGRRVLRVALAPLALVGGGVVGVAVVLLHSYVWGFVLGLVTTAAVLWALPARLWSRLPFALGWCLVVLGLTLRGPGGDLLIPADRTGYLLLGCCVPVLITGTLSALVSRRAAPTEVPTS